MILVKDIGFAFMEWDLKKNKCFFFISLLNENSKTNLVHIFCRLMVA